LQQLQQLQQLQTIKTDSSQLLSVNRAPEAPRGDLRARDEAGEIDTGPVATQCQRSELETGYAAWGLRKWKRQGKPPKW